MAELTYVTTVGGNPVFKEETASYAGDVAGQNIIKEQTAQSFYMNSDGTISTTSSDGKSYTFDPAVESDGGISGYLSSVVNSFGSVAGTLIDLVNKGADAYEKATGQKVIQTSASQVKSTGLSAADESRINMILNSAINKIKSYGIFIGIGVGGVILIYVLKNKKRSKK